MTNPKHMDTSRSGDLVERLRETAHAFARWEPVLADEVKEAADLFERLQRYAAHRANCPVSYGATDDQCLCGLTALIKEIEGD